MGQRLEKDFFLKMTETEKCKSSSKKNIYQSEEDKYSQYESDIKIRAGTLTFSLPSTDLNMGF